MESELIPWVFRNLKECKSLQDVGTDMFGFGLLQSEKEARAPMYDRGVGRCFLVEGQY